MTTLRSKNRRASLQYSSSKLSEGKGVPCSIEGTVIVAILTTNKLITLIEGGGLPPHRLTHVVA